jgi:hypothetical protein
LKSWSTWKIPTILEALQYIRRFLALENSSSNYFPIELVSCFQEQFQQPAMHSQWSTHNSFPVVTTDHCRLLIPSHTPRSIRNLVRRAKEEWESQQCPKYEPKVQHGSHCSTVISIHNYNTTVLDERRKMLTFLIIRVVLSPSKLGFKSIMEMYFNRRIVKSPLLFITLWAKWYQLSRKIYIP